MYPDPDPARFFNPGIDTYSGPFNLSNLDYPRQLEPSGWSWDTPLTTGDARAYMDKLKAHIQPSISVLVQDAQNWDPVEHSWYNMVWRGAGSPNDPTSGREAIMNTHTGQIVPSSSWSEEHRPTTEFMQNYGVIYYNKTAAYMLGQVWRDLYDPDYSNVVFPEGSIVVKVEAATVQPNQWPWHDAEGVESVLQGAASWKVYRPWTADQKAHQRDPSYPLQNRVQTVYPFQMAIKVKDSVASPQTGWVYMGFVFDARVIGTVWDKFVPAGMMWGNDPDLALTRNGITADDQLKETWINPDAPSFVRDTVGWGGRMAAPMDVAVRHNVVFPSGKRLDDPEGFRASSCLSCHGTAQHPFTANLYPSPNRYFPPDGLVAFPLYEPGSPKWAEWFQNRPGDQPLSDYDGIEALDYDLSMMIALGIWAGSGGQKNSAIEGLNGH